MQRIVLTRDAMELAELVARTRNHVKRRVGAADRKVDNRQSIEIDLEGANV